MKLKTDSESYRFFIGAIVRDFLEALFPLFAVSTPKKCVGCRSHRGWNGKLWALWCSNNLKNDQFKNQNDYLCKLF
jgi:hypothetical protein